MLTWIKMEYPTALHRLQVGISATVEHPSPETACAKGRLDVYDIEIN
jgi:hypothetical protein